MSKRTENCETCEALKSECEDLREAAKDCVGDDHQPYCRHYKRLKADNERLKAEVAEWQQSATEAACMQDLREEQLTELREAAEDAAEKLEEFDPAWPRDQRDDYETAAWEEAQELRAVLAKVKP